MPMANQPYWLVNKQELRVDIIVAGKAWKSWQLPAVCARYTGDTQAYVIADEAEKIRKAHHSEYLAAQHAWAIVQELTPNDKEYLHYHKLWRESCDRHGYEDAASRALERELGRRAGGLTTAGNEAVNVFNKSRSTQPRKA